MQLGEDPSISQVANRFIGTGRFSAPLPGKLSRPLLSAMLDDVAGPSHARRRKNVGSVNCPVIAMVALTISTPTDLQKLQVDLGMSCW